jgi:type II secretory pathway component PulJ
VSRTFLEQDGVTLIEQLVSLLLGSVLITSLYTYFRAELYRTASVESKTGTLEDARGAVDIMIHDLMNAGSWQNGSAPLEIGAGDDPEQDSDLVCNRVYAASPGTIHIQMDLNGNGNCADADPRENIRYELTNPTGTCPGPQIIRRNGDCLVANVVPALPGKVFTYYDANGAELGSNPARDAIKRVKIAFSVQVKNPDPNGSGNLTSTVLSSVEFRN